MSSYTSQTNLWLERSRLDGTVLAGVSYGVFSVLTVQSFFALMKRPPHGGKIADHRIALIFYIIITFILVTISTAASIKYTEMIWIDLQDDPGGPLALIQNAWKYTINNLALSCGHIQEWVMQILLLHRCFVIWNWARFVTISMTVIYFVMIGLSIAVQVETSTGATLYNLNTELAYICVQVGHTVLYTVIVVYRLLVMRSRLNQVMGECNSGPYGTIILMIVESVVVFTASVLIFIFAFGFKDYGITTICFLNIGKVQGITQLFIILRVAKGRAITQEWSTRAAAVPTTLMFARTSSSRSDTTNSRGEGMAEPGEKVVDDVDIIV